MPISFMSMNRLLEEQARKDEEYRRKLERNNKKTLSDGRVLSDDELLKKLESLGLHVDRHLLGRVAKDVPCAEAVAKQLLAQWDDIPECESDWVWIALVCLWERWFPDRPNFEMTDDWIQAGYEAQERGETVEACEHWARAWNGVKYVMQTGNLRSLDEYEGFGSIISVHTFIRDYSWALSAAELDDGTYRKQRVDLCRDVTQLAEKTDRDKSLLAVICDDSDACLSGDETDEAAIETERVENVSEMELDGIIDQLNRESTGQLPVDAIREAQGRREDIIPRLIDLIEDATRRLEDGETPTEDGPLLALYLLTEFRAKQALPAVVEALSIPEEEPFDLFGDGVVEDLDAILAALAVDSPETIDALIADRFVNEFVRWSAASTFLFWVRDESMTRDVAVEKLRRHLRDAIEHQETEIITYLVEQLAGFSPHEAEEEIAEAFRKGLVDDAYISQDKIQRAIKEGKSFFRRSLERCRPTGIQDTVNHLVERHGYSESPLDETDSYPRPMMIPEPVIPGPTIPQPRQDPPSRDPPPQLLPYVPPTIRNTEPRVGRNDPCPCGSGKKYKKCCSRSE